MRFTRRLLAVVVAGFAAVASGPAIAAAVIGTSLQQKLATLPPAATIEVVVTFDSAGPLGTAQIASLGSTGVKGLYMQALPIAGVVATKAQVDQIAQLPGVRSVWLNEQLQYFNAEARALTGVDRARTDSNLRNAIGLPWSGKGIGVLINDSGIDGTHADVSYGAKTLQNVLGTTNLRAYDTLLPITYVEGVPDTDIGSGHGTHVAATAAGTGAASGGLYAGVAPGANLIGYGSGGVILILDAIGGLDYALVNQFRYNIRVVNNSWGDGGTRAAFDPNDPISVATKRLADRNIIVVFAAGNDGSGEGTIGGTYIKAPWVVTAGAANKDGTLADFSSRGVKGGGGTVSVDGESFTWKDRPNVVAPGVDIISALANTGVLGIISAQDADYAILEGTSMAAPHVAGIVAMMLEANPQLGWPEVIDILEDTATNMQGRESWEVGAGFVNAYGAVMTAAGKRADFGVLPIVNRTFNANVLEARIGGPTYDLAFNPVVANDVRTFNVAAGLSTVIASASVPDNTVAIVLRDPNGGRYGSAISLPQLGENISVTAPAVPGTWTVEIRGIGSVSGVVLDPLGLTQGTAVPGTVRVAIQFNRIDGFTGLNDVAGHAGRGFIERAVAERLLDSRTGGFFQPDALMTRGELADYVTQGAAIRQFRKSAGGYVFSDTLTGVQTAAAEAATARGAALRDLRQTQKGVIAVGATFNPTGSVLRADLAFTLVQSLGLEAEAEAVRVNLADEPITVAYDTQRIALADDAAVPAALRGYVQLALDLQLMAANFALVQGPFDLQPKLEARFDPATAVNRAGYAFTAVNLFDRLNQAAP